jgi:hypothetical protein
MFLGIPVYTWILQLLYVAVALAILFVYVSVNKRTTWELVLFVAIVIIIDIIWRLAIK